MQENIKVEYYKSPYGELILGSHKDDLCICDWRYRKMRDTIDKRIKDSLNLEYIFESSDVIEKTKSQLKEYFKGEREEFELDVLMIGSEFQKSVWHALIQIPYGKTETYLGLSKKLNNEKAIRAVASANGANAISIIVPCHRIIGTNGKLVGYAGGITVKKKLLSLENALYTRQLSLF